VLLAISFTTLFSCKSPNTDYWTPECSGNGAMTIKECRKRYQDASPRGCIFSTPSWLFIALVLLLAIPTACESPTSPENVEDRLLVGELFWFVQKDHVSLEMNYRVPGYAYVTVFDNSAFTDDSDVVVFSSTTGDTERVQLHLVSVGGIATYSNSGGTSVYLNHLLGQECHDGVLYVDGSVSTITAVYRHHQSGNTLQINASVRH
jgi:hypothetical protein